MITARLYLILLITFLTALLPFRSSLITSSHALSGGDNLLFAESDSDKSIIDPLFGPRDTQPPIIQLKDLSNSQTVYTEKMYIAGQIIDDNKIETLTLNKTPILNRTGRSIFFSHLADLKEGKNIITIEASDEAGNRSKKEIAVTRIKVEPAQLPKEIIDRRMRLVVYPFVQKGTFSGAGSFFQDILAFSLQNHSRFQLIDRESLDLVLEEQKLSQSQLVDINTAVNLGKMMAAQAIITGSIVDTPAGTEAVGRMIDTETAEILATEKVFCDKRDAAALNFLAESMAVKFHNDFPMLQGIIIKRTGRQIVTDLGEDKISLNGRLIIYRENNPETGRMPKAKSVILGYARVTQVLQDMSKAELISGSLDEIKELDRIIVQ